MQRKTAQKSIPTSENAATAAANTKTGTTNAQHGLRSPVGLTTCGDNFHLILPRKRTWDFGPEYFG
jgi:hypothetical protein